MQSVSSKEKVLIIGATGLLGVALSEYLRSEDEFDLCLASLRGGASISAVDFTDEKAAKKFLNENKPDIIVNAAALTNVDLCETERTLAFNLNAGIVRNLSDWVLENPKSFLIQISTDMFYNNFGNNLESTAVPINIYAMTKYIGELYAQRCQSCVLRTNFFGPSQVEGRMSFSDWIKDKALKEDGELTVFNDVYFSPLSLKTLVQKLHIVMKRKTPGVYNLGSRDGMSKSDFAEEIFNLEGCDKKRLKPLSIDELALKAVRPKNMMMNVSSFEETFKVSLPTLKSELINI